MSNTGHVRETGQSVSVNITKLSGAMRQIFLGCAAVFDSIGEGPVEIMVPDVSQIIMTEKTEPAESFMSATVKTAENTDEKGMEVDAPVKKNAPAENTEAAETATSSVTVNDIIKIASAKITANRKNSDKIQKLIAAYGVSKMSELPESKFEAFLTDISQL